VPAFQNALFCLHRPVGASYLLAMKMEQQCVPKSWHLNYRQTLMNNPEESIQHVYYCKRLKNAHFELLNFLVKLTPFPSTPKKPLMNYTIKYCLNDHNKNFSYICNFVTSSRLLKHTTAYGNILTLCRSELKSQENKNK
jgi:hypothetical protein